MLFNRIEVFFIANFYGILFLIGSIPFIILGILINSFSMRILSSTCFILILFSSLKILSKYGIKRRIILITEKRINNHGFKPIFFKSLCGDPCLRFITLTFLLKLNKLKYYKKLVRKYRKYKFGYPIIIPSTIQLAINRNEYTEEQFFESIV